LKKIDYAYGMKRQLITWIVIIGASLALGFFVEARI
jgi:hypothetical protein